MNITNILNQTAAVAVVAERITEILKPSYLSLKNKIFKKEQSECTKLEKIAMTILFSVLICVLTGIGIDIPGISEKKILQEILAGLVSSFGSNILHMLLSVLTGVKNVIEASNIRMRESGTSGTDKK
jgi:hypothetical protein